MNNRHTNAGNTSQQPLLTSLIHTHTHVDRITDTEKDLDMNSKQTHEHRQHTPSPSPRTLLLSFRSDDYCCIITPLSLLVNSEVLPCDVAWGNRWLHGTPCCFWTKLLLQLQETFLCDVAAHNQVPDLLDWSKQHAVYTGSTTIMRNKFKRKYLC